MRILKLTKDSLKNLEDEYYVHGFFRTHTGYLVNLEYVYNIIIECIVNVVIK